MSNTTNTTSTKAAASVTAADAKKAEYARLFDLLERLASRRSRQDASLVAMTDMPTSQELDPLLKRLSAIVNTNMSKSKARGRPRRNTVASVVEVGGKRATNNNGDAGSDMSAIEEQSSAAGACPGEDEDEIESLTKFPLENAKDYPFTFRLMIHKLYKKEEWVKTIKEMLEKSKMEYKSLAERQKEQASAASPNSEGVQPGQEDVGEKDMAAIRFKVPTSPGAVAGGRRGRQRSQSVAGAAPNKVLSPTSPSGLRSPGSTTEATSRQPDVRAVKKRCVGRRKSMSEPLNADAGQSEAASTLNSPKFPGTWVYDAAISSAERPGAITTFNAFPPGPPPSPSGAAHLVAAKRFPGSLHATGSPGAGSKMRASNAGEVPMLMPLQHVTNMNAGGLAARRWVIKPNNVEDGSEELKKAAKRPFAG